MADGGVRGVHPGCINVSNPFHDGTNYCFRQIAETKAQQAQPEEITAAAAVDPAPTLSPAQEDDAQSGETVNAPEQAHPKKTTAAAAIDPAPTSSPAQEDAAQSDGEIVNAPEGAEGELDSEAYAQMTEKQKKLFDLRLKLNAARKANRTAIVAERKREEAPEEVRGVSKQKWFAERQKRLGKVLDSNGLDMTKVYMLDTQEQAETKYDKWEKKPAPFGWDVFNQKSLYSAYKKRTKTIPYGMEDYLKAREADPYFYRNGSSLQCGKAPEIPDENIDRMVNEVTDRGQKCKEFSRRRKFHDEKDIDSINDRNEHFNLKIERAFGKYTAEMKNNLERGTALPD